MKPCFLDSSTKIFKALGVACGSGGGWSVYLFRGCCRRSWGGDVLGGLGGVIGGWLWGGQFLGGVVNCWRGVHAGGGLGAGLLSMGF